MYRVSQCIYPTKNQKFREGWILEHDSFYPFTPNRFLHQMNNGSPNTAKQYAYKLCKFFNYLEERWCIDYRTATKQHLNKFFTYMTYGSDNKIVTLSEAQMSGFTLKSYFTIIKRFYSFLSSNNESMNMEIEIVTNSAKDSYLYGQYWESKKTKLALNNTIDRGKLPINYIKWYTDEDIDAIFSNLNTDRDKAIFSMSLDGLRIDEILSLRLSDYSDSDGFVTLYKSKGRLTGGVNRTCPLSERTLEFLNNYIFNERNEIEIEFIDNGMLPSEALFLNLKNRADSYGTPVKYHNMLEIIKKAAKNAGLDPKRIRTHSGRSTKAGELFRMQAKNPASITDNQILEIMGWKNLSSAEPYKNRQDKETALENWKLLSKLKEERHEEND